MGDHGHAPGTGHRHDGHDHGPGGHRGHGHAHGPASYDRAFAIGIALNLGFVLVEAVYGVLGNSLALMADAGHNLSDVLSLLLAWVQRPRSPSAGRPSGTPMASGAVPSWPSLVNAVLLLVAVGGIGWEAVRRFAEPQPVAEMTEIVVRRIGIVDQRGDGNDVHVRPRARHQHPRRVPAHGGRRRRISGRGGAALAIMMTGWLWLDPAISLAIAAVMTSGPGGCCGTSLNLALDAVPAGIDRSAVEAYPRRPAGRHRGPRPAYLGDEHDRSGA